jgi:hypothetical protein
MKSINDISFYKIFYNKTLNRKYDAQVSLIFDNNYFDFHYLYLFIFLNSLIPFSLAFL